MMQRQHGTIGYVQCPSTFTRSHGVAPHASECITACVTGAHRLQADVSWNRLFLESSVWAYGLRTCSELSPL
eukprot:4493564-Pyramimonas_sp.AAC.1